MLFTESSRLPSQHLLSHLSAWLALLLTLSFSSCVCAAGDQQAVTRACPGCIPSQAGAFPAASQGGMVTSSTELGASVSSQERSSQQAVPSQSPGGGFLWGKIIVTWLCCAPDRGLWQPSVLQAENGNMLLLWNGAVSWAQLLWTPACLAKVAGSLDLFDYSNITDVWGMEAGAGDLRWI